MDCNLDKYRLIDTPYKCLIVENFLSLDLLQHTFELFEKLKKLLQSEYPYGRLINYVDCRRIAGLLLSKELRLGIGELLDRRLKVSHKSLPQWRVFPSGNTGLPVHNDFDQNGIEEINFILHLNRDWHPDDGGQFQLWNWLPDKEPMLHSSIEPISNTLVAFVTSPKSYHSVRSYVGDKGRLAIG